MALGGKDLAAIAIAFAFGVTSAILPFANAEAFVAAAQVAHASSGMAAAVAVALGQSLGKLALFLAVRKGKSSRFIRRDRPKRTSPAWLLRWRTLISRLLTLVSSPQWGIPIVLLASIFGIPPVYAVALVAGASQMRALWFFLAVVVGRIIRLCAIALMAQAGLQSFWP